MRRKLEPDSSHPIETEVKTAPVSVKAGGHVILSVPAYVELRESTYPPVAYLPRPEALPSSLKRSDRTTWCPYKGEAAYYHIEIEDGHLIEDAVWTYEAPFEAVAAITDHLAFYPSKIDALEIG